MCLPYVKGLSEKIESTCRSVSNNLLKIKPVFRPDRTIRHTLVRVKNRIPEEKKMGVVYEVPCKDCDGVYVGETGRTLKKWISEHKQAVRHMDDKSGIAVHIQRMVHRIDREKASITATEEFYWKRRIQEALQIHSHPTTMNLDCGLSLSHFWLP